uniref:PH domain-containing protein n=1 Tax=Sphaeramia orbicularis TaxID=375764 RepID=A0A672Z2P3_9TELE
GGGGALIILTAFLYKSQQQQCFSLVLFCRLQQKTWRKVWTVLFKPSSTGVGRLELCNICDSPMTDQKKAGRLKPPERKVVRLSDCLSITSAPKESCPSQCTAFYLNTTICTYTLASDTSQDWISALCLLAFQVTPLNLQL